ncbi:MAG: hypothetical protein LBP78_07140 [Acidaminococcales bacterium]|nr:hypothetical protein [Acidaminococcales bacterium]
MGKTAGTCDACGATLPRLGGIRYCPYCGNALPKNNGGEGETDIKNHLSLEEQQHAVREKYAGRANDPRVKVALPEDIYTLALKGCENREALVECLNQVLTRGESAIRLAVAAMPSVLLYKANIEAVNEVAAALKDAEAAYAVVEGNFDYSSFYKSAYFTNLDRASRALLKSVPKTMWLGENIKFISEDMFFEGKRGYGVFSNNSFFFFWIENGVSSLILPVYQLDGIDLWEKEDRFLGEWLTRDGRTFQLEFARKEDFDAIRELSWD